MFKSNKITVGVVIPNRNDGKYLPVCIRSILQQSSLPDEIIYVDDNSTDDSVEIAINLLSEFKNTTIIRNKKSVGAMAVLNQGIKISKCDYLIFPASNDALADGIIENFRRDVEVLCKLPGIWSALVDFINEDGVVLKPYFSPLLAFKSKYISPKDCIGYANKLGNWFTGTTAIYNRETLIDVGMFQTKFGGLADLFAALQISSLRGAIFCPKKYGFQRFHGEGFLYRTLDNLNQIDSILSLIVNHGRKHAPELFKDPFIKKTINRIRFASLAQQKKFSTPDIPKGWLNFSETPLRFIAYLLPKSIFLFLLYLAMRPADVIPATYYRFRCFLKRSVL